MSWLQLETVVGQQRPETLEPILEELGATAVWFRDAGEEPILEPKPGETPLWSATIVAALFPRDTDTKMLAAALADFVDGSALRFTHIDERDWQADWQRTLRPMHFGGRLWVVPDGVAFDEPGVSVRMTPGLAFGTGEHPTTAMCLKWLESQPLAGCKVLDYGCGSGLLAIASLALGADEACTVDIDSQALAATRDNAAKNSCLESMVVCGPEEIEPGRQYDVLVANILSGTLIELGPAISKLLQPNARLALSGILEDQAEAVCTAWSDWADLDKGMQDQNWVLLTGRKRGIQD
jgi:ribosomal protein L11 methyltransferase